MADDQRRLGVLRDPGRANGVGTRRMPPSSSRPPHEAGARRAERGRTPRARRPRRGQPAPTLAPRAARRGRRRARRPGTRAAACSTSGATSAGPWARSRASTPATCMARHAPRRRSLPGGDRGHPRPDAREARADRGTAQAPGHLQLGRAFEGAGPGSGRPARNAAIRSSASSRTGSSPWPRLGIRDEPPMTSVGIAASRRSIRANGSDVPDSSRAGTSIAGQCADPRLGRLGRARPVERVGQADEAGVRVNARAPRPRRAPRRPPATPPGRRTSARRPPTPGSSGTCAS